MTYLLFLSDLGSEAVDAPLVEIVDYVIRDYVLSWYNKIASSDKVCKLMFKLNILANIYT